MELNFARPFLLSNVYKYLNGSDITLYDTLNDSFPNPFIHL